MIQTRWVATLSLPGTHCRLGTLGRESDLALGLLKQRLWIVDRSGLHHDPHFARVPDVREWISVDHEEIRELPCLDRAELIGHAECARTVDGRDLERGGVGNAGEHERVQLAMRGEARDELAAARVVGA